MSWRAIAEKDVRDASQSRVVWLLTALLFAAFVGYSVAHSYLGDETFPAYLEGTARLAASLLPVIAILLGYKSIVHERTSGSLFLTLSFSHSRRDVIVGKFVGRSIVLLVPSLVMLVVAGIVGMVQYGTDGIVFYPWFLLVTALYAITFIAITMALSMLTTVDRWITLGAVGSYLLLVQFWDNFHTLTVLVLHRFNFEVLKDMPDWTLLFRLLKPSELYYRLLRAGFDVSLAGRYVVEGAPLYVGWWVALGLLCLWVVVPLAVGYRRFVVADL